MSMCGINRVKAELRSPFSSPQKLIRYRAFHFSSRQSHFAGTFQVPIISPILTGKGYSGALTRSYDADINQFFIFAPELFEFQIRRLTGRAFDGLAKLGTFFRHPVESAIVNGEADMNLFSWGLTGIGNLPRKIVGEKLNAIFGSETLTVLTVGVLKPHPWSLILMKVVDSGLEGFPRLLGLNGIGEPSISFTPLRSKRGSICSISGLSSRDGLLFNLLKSVVHERGLVGGDSSIYSGRQEREPSSPRKSYLKPKVFIVLGVLVSLFCWGGLCFSDNVQRYWYLVLLILPCCFCDIAYCTYLLLE